MILLGFGVYTGHDKDIMDLDQIVVFDRTTTTINIWNVQQSSNQAARLIACQSEIITTKMARAKILQKGDQVWEPGTFKKHFSFKAFVSESRGKN